VKAIPVEVRERILKLYEAGRSTEQIAESFGYCVAAVRRVRQHFRERASTTPRTHLCGRKTLLTRARKERLQKLLAASPEATLAELGAAFDRPFGSSTVDVWLRRLGWSYKKNAPRRRTSTPRRGGKKSTLV